MADTTKLRTSILRLAQTPDGAVLFEHLHKCRETAHRYMRNGEGRALVAAQGQYELLLELFGHENLTDSRPK